MNKNNRNDQPPKIINYIIKISKATLISLKNLCLYDTKKAFGFLN